MKKNKIYYKNEELIKDNKTLKMCEVRNKTIIIGDSMETIASKEYDKITVVPFKKDIYNAITNNNKIMFDIPKTYNNKFVVSLSNYVFDDDINETLNDIKELYVLMEDSHKPDFFKIHDEVLLYNCLKVLKELELSITLENIKKMMFDTNGDGRRMVIQYSKKCESSDISNWFFNEYYSGMNNSKGMPKIFEHTCSMRNCINSLDNGISLHIYILLLFKNLAFVLSDLKTEITVVIEDLDTYESISNISYGNLFKTTYYINNKNINYICFVHNLLFIRNLDENLQELILEEHELIDLKPSDLYSGEIKLRVPKILHQELARKASLENTSLNQYLLYLISKNS